MISRGQRSNCGQQHAGIDPGDHDAICQACDLDAELFANAILDRAALNLEAALNTENAAKLRAMRPELRRVVVTKCIEDGHMKWALT